MKKKILITALGLSTCIGTSTSQAALDENTILAFDPGAPFCLIGGTYPTCQYGVSDVGGSFFGMEMGPGNIAKVALTPGPDGGVIMQQTQLASGSHGGAPNGTESPSVDMPWGFFCNTGMQFISAPVTVSNEDVNGDGLTKELDLSGWNVTWNGIPAIGIGGTATIVCSAADCPIGSTYVLDYATLIPPSTEHGFGGVPYSLHLEGTVAALPIVSRETVMTESDTAVVFDIATNATDADGTVMAATALVETAPLHGTMTNPGDGTLSYTPNTGFSGTDTFTVTIEDDSGYTSVAGTQTVLVNAMTPGSNMGDLVAGATAGGIGNTTGGGLTSDDTGIVDPDVRSQCVGGCVDFVVNNLTPGDTINVVVPLSASIPAAAMYRKLIGGLWVDFVIDADNAVATAAAVSKGPLVCPEAGNAAYTPGLKKGHRCLQITMKDGGANDADAAEDGTVMDPGGIATNAKAGSSAAAATTSSSGCNISNKPASFKQHGDWWIVLGFLAFLGLYRRKSSD